MPDVQVDPGSVPAPTEIRRCTECSGIWCTAEDKCRTCARTVRGREGGGFVDGGVFVDPTLREWRIARTDSGPRTDLIEYFADTAGQWDWNPRQGATHGMSSAELRRLYVAAYGWCEEQNRVR